MKELRKLSIFLLALVLLPSAVSAETAAADDPLSFYSTTGFRSKYVFRGMVLYDGFSVQPNLGASYNLGEAGTLNFGVWVHLPAEDHDVKVIDQFSEDTSGISSLNNDEIFSPSKKFVEVDPTISYDLTLGLATLTLGHTWYTDPKKGRVTVIRREDIDGVPTPVAFRALYSRGDTSEFFASASLDTVLNPEVTIVKDYRKYEYWYYTLGFSEPIFITKDDDATARDDSFTITPNVLFAWATNTPSGDRGNFSTNYDKNGLVHVNVGAKGRLSAENFTVMPIFTYIFAVDTNQGPDDIIWIGFDVDFSI